MTTQEHHTGEILGQAHTAQRIGGEFDAILEGDAGFHHRGLRQQPSSLPDYQWPNAFDHFRIKTTSPGSGDRPSQAETVSHQLEAEEQSGNFYIGKAGNRR